MFKYSLVFFCYYVLNVVGFELIFNSCDTEGWKCHNSSDNLIDIVFSCKKDFEKRYPVVTWKFRRLPSKTQSMTIENCDISLTLDSHVENIGVNKENLSSKNQKHISNYLKNFKSITVRNINTLIFTEHFGDVVSRLRGNATLLVEDIKRIKQLPKEFIRGPSPYVHSMKMEGLNFTMKNVNIEWIVYHSVFWYKEKIPLLMVWERVIVNDADVGIIEVVPTAADTPFLNYEEPENNQVYIYKCRFTIISDLMFTLNTTIFHFIDNKVDLLESHGFDVDSIHTIISGNMFRKVKNNAFGYITLGYSTNSFLFENNTFHESAEKALLFEDSNYDYDFEERVSFRGNKMNCNNSAWLHRSKIENYKTLDLVEDDYSTLVNVENMFYRNSDNVCIDLECLISVAKYRKIYLKNETNPDYCS